MLRGVDLFLKPGSITSSKAGRCGTARPGPATSAHLLEAEALVRGHGVVEVLDDLDEASVRAASSTCMLRIVATCGILRRCRPQPSSAPPGTPARRRSTACSPTPSSSSSRSVRLARRCGASALDVRLNGHLPSFVPNDEALGAGADVIFACLGNEEAAAPRPARRCGRRRSLGCAPAARRVALRGLVRVRAPAADALADWSYAVPELGPPADRSSRTRPSARAAILLRLRRSPTSSTPARSSSTRSRACRAPAARSGSRRTPAACSRERRVLLPRRRAPARAGDRAGARLSSGQFLPHLLPVRRGLLVTLRRRERDRGAARGHLFRRRARPRPPRRRRARARARARDGHRRARRLRGPRDGQDDRRLRTRQPRQGRRRPGGAEREPRARPAGDGGAARPRVLV